MRILALRHDTELFREEFSVKSYLCSWHGTIPRKVQCGVSFLFIPLNFPGKCSVRKRGVLNYTEVIGKAYREETFFHIRHGSFLKRVEKMIDRIKEAVYFEHMNSCSNIKICSGSHPIRKEDL